MDSQQAKAISETGHMNRVTYNGKPVFIQRVNDQNETARIFHIEDPQEEFDVELSQLEEHESL